MLGFIGIVGVIFMLNLLYYAFSGDYVYLLLAFVMIPFIIIGLWKILESYYFASSKFIEVKDSIEENTNNCNDLNDHIENLKLSFVEFKKIDYGDANLSDNSNYNYKRPEHTGVVKSSFIHDCSLSVCKGAEQQPFKYICKYFEIKADEQTVSSFEKILNDFAAAEEGIRLLIQERDEILQTIWNKIPFFIKAFCKIRLIRELGFNDIDFSNLYHPRYEFRYVSPGGNSSLACDVVLDVNMLERFIDYLAHLVKFKKSIAGQRALMTSALRERIKIRDNFTCQYCRLSTSDEPNLLLEIDHIIPLSKSGITSLENLQTLCWKCNRSKGNKLINRVVDSHDDYRA